MNAEGENPAAPSCAPSATPSAAGATAVASAAEPAAEPAAPQARPLTSFFNARELLPVCVLLLLLLPLLLAAAGTAAGANVEATTLPQQPVDVSQSGTHKRPGRVKTQHQPRTTGGSHRDATQQDATQ